MDEDAEVEAKPDLDPPFTGGWFLYLGYELAQSIEPSLNLSEAEDGLPVATATRFPAAILCDHLSVKVYLLAEASEEGLLEQMQQDAAQLRKENRSAMVVSHIEEDDETPFLQGVSRIRDYIVEGDVFQVNLSRSWSANIGIQADCDAPSRVYRELRQSNPAPFAALATWGNKAVISSSPERLVRVQGEWVETRPIAGTRPRGDEEFADGHLKEELIQHPKERAEHIMLIDLERNDLGRISRPGTVEVDELMVVESYTHVHHIVSNVRGQLAQDVGPGDVIRAVFPGGTITGCPKVRCMEIIAELEQSGRGAYTGSLGYLNHSGDMDLNILIRSFVLNGNRLSWRAGAGIVADSIPEAELMETRNKAKGLVLALGGQSKD